MDRPDKTEEQGLDLLKLLDQIWCNKRFIIKTTIIAFFLGLIIAISIPKEYTSYVKMTPEEGNSNISGSFSNLAAIAGISVNSVSTEGINLNLYPDIIKSIPFMTDLISIHIPGKGTDTEGTLYNYLDKELKQPWWNKIIIAPLKLLKKRNPENSKAINPYKLTKEQEDIVNLLNKRISVSIDKKTGAITVKVKMQHPEIAAFISDSLVSKLEKYVIDYRTSKAKQDYDFALKMYDEAKLKYYIAQKNYARYLDENKNIVLESVLIEQERLKNEQDLAYNVYSTLAQQVENQKLKVQERTPCLTIIEPARIPANKSNLGKSSLIIIVTLMGIIIGMSIITYKNRDKIRL